MQEEGHAHLRRPMHLQPCGVAAQNDEAQIIRLVPVRGRVRGRVRVRVRVRGRVRDRVRVRHLC